MNFSINKAALCLAGLATALPLTTHATEMQAVDHCVQVFIKEVVPADRVADVKREDIRTAIKPITAQRSKVTLIARGEKDANVFGRASCVVDRNGSVVGLYLYESKRSSMGSGRPKVLARNVDVSKDVRTAKVGDTKPF